MANVVASFDQTPTLFFVPDIDQKTLVVAHRMAETYCGTKFPLSQAVVNYTVDEFIKPLPMPVDYPINNVLHVRNSQGNDEQYDYNDQWIFAKPQWSSTPLIATVIGGIQPQVYDAIIRQANALSKRRDIPMEIQQFDLGSSLKYDANPQFRTGLASDVKHMLFPFKVIGF